MDGIAEGTEVTLPFVVTDRDMSDFAALSGDRNALHMDGAFARSRGFDGPVVYGGLIVAKISALLGMHVPGPNGIWVGLDIQFKHPLYVGVPAALKGVVDHVSLSTGMVTLKLRVDAAGRCVAKGTAQSVVMADG